jgi:hypothetical protein
MTVIRVCVILHLKRHAFVITSVQYNFFMIYLLTCKAWRTSRRGLAKSHSNNLANQLVSLKIPNVS